MGLYLGFYTARSYSLVRPPRTGRRLIRSREVSDGEAGPGRAELAAAVGAPVVVPGVLSQDDPQVAFAEDQHPVGDLRPGGEHEPFGVAFARGASTGVLMMRTPVAVNTASNAAVNLVSRSRIRNLSLAA
jgi:hypothetical protein